MLYYLKRFFQLLRTEPDTIVSKVRQRRLDALKTAIQTRWPHVPTSIVWDDQAHDAEPPSEREAVLSRLRDNRLSLAIASRVQRLNAIRELRVFVAFQVLMAITFIVPFFGLTGTGVLPLALAFPILLTWLVVAVASLWFALGLTPSSWLLVLPKDAPVTDADIDDADAFISRVLVHDLPEGTPADLCDRWRVLALDAEGEPVDGQIIQGDLRESYLHNALKTVSVHYLLIGIAAMLMLLPAIMGFFGPRAAALGVIGMAGISLAGGTSLPSSILWGRAALSAARLFLLPDAGEKRAALAQRAAESAPASRLVEEFGREPFRAIEHARIQQRARAAADDSAFIRLGTSTATLAARRDGYAPTEAVPFGLTVDDLSTHLLALGDTGTGKTAGVLRPVLQQWLDANAGGVVVLDGKGALPRELAEDPRFRLITPSAAAYNPIAGLEPDDIANTLYEQNASGEGDSAFWEQSAVRMIRASATLMKVLHARDATSWPWTLGTLYRLACTKNGIDEARQALPPSEADSLSEHDRRAVVYRLSEFRQLPDKMRGSIEGYVQAWLTTIVDTEKLADWVDCHDSDVSILGALRGEALAFDLPESEYGPAGPALSSLVKSQLYRALKIRGDLRAAARADDTQMPVLALIDECQEVIADDDVAMLPIARSLGLRAVFATQAIDGIYRKVGEDAALSLLPQFRSIVALTVSSERTREFVAERMGASYRSSVWSVTADHADAHALALAATRTPGGFIKGSSGYEATWRSSTAHEMRVSTGIGGDMAAGLRQFSGAVGISELADSLPIMRHRRNAPATLQINKELNVEADEISSLTSVPWYALASINRAGVPRRDVIELIPMFGFARDEQDVIEGEAEDVTESQNNETLVLEGA